MPEKQNYNTKSRKYILEFLESRRDCTVSAADVVNHLKANGISVNQATVYRYINKLSDEHRLLKFSENDNNKAVYRYIQPEQNCGGHIHIKCLKCGRIMHLECDFMEDIRRHLEDEHSFTLSCDGSILYGICGDCKK